ncbi:MAG TPA: hypothetical protein VK993_11275, partial [Chthoniobacterales bacterium]|nr:hypothetical protein [Chthoniobacterales bacterium]
MLKNISTVCVSERGDNALICGFIIGGNSPREVIVRAIGPSLNPRGVPEAMADPVLELYRGGELIAQNDDWEAGSRGNRFGGPACHPRRTSSRR